jgi:hypothetical protein
VVEALKSDRENVEVDLVVESLRSSDGSPLDEAGKRRFRCEMSERWFVRADPIAIETLEGEGGSRWLRLRRPVTIDIAKIEENDRRYSKSFEGLRVRWEAAAALIRRTLRQASDSPGSNAARGRGPRRAMSGRSNVSYGAPSEGSAREAGAEPSASLPRQPARP